MENLHNDDKLQRVKLPFAINSSILSFNLCLLTEKKSLSSSYLICVQLVKTFLK